MKTVIVTGGSGNIGSILVPMLIEHGYQVIIFTRNIRGKISTKGLSYARWSPDEGRYDGEAVSRADAIINLAGAGIADKRWTPSRMREIASSRVDSGATIVKALTETDNQVQTVINASGIGYYGPAGNDHLFTENDPAGEGFLADVCKAWEESVQEVAELGKRLVYIRTGVVLDADSGMHEELSVPLSFRVGIVPGSGKQMLSWIHLQDICSVYLFALENDQMFGAFNACAPHPVDMQKMIAAMGQQKWGNGFINLPIPAPLLRMGLGRMADEALLKGAAVSSSKLHSAGFRFRYPELREALSSLNPKD